MLTKQQETYLNQLANNLRKMLLPCEHIGINTDIREIGYEYQYDTKINSIETIVIYEEFGLCKKCGEFYRNRFKRMSE